MQMKDSDNSYSIVTKVMHLIIACCILSLLVVGFYMSDMENSEEKRYLYYMHKSCGFLVLILATLRVIWRLNNVLPNFNDDPKFSLIKKIVLVFLYTFSVVMPLSGVLLTAYHGREIPFFSLFSIDLGIKNEIFGEFFLGLHELGAIVISVAISVHVAGVLYHLFVIKDKTVIRRIM